MQNHAFNSVAKVQGDEPRNAENPNGELLDDEINHPTRPFSEEWCEGAVRSLRGYVQRLLRGVGMIGLRDFVTMLVKLVVPIIAQIGVLIDH